MSCRDRHLLGIVVGDGDRGCADADEGIRADAGDGHGEGLVGLNHLAAGHLLQDVDFEGEVGRTAGNGQGVGVDTTGKRPGGVLVVLGRDSRCRGDFEGYVNRFTGGHLNIGGNRDLDRTVALADRLIAAEDRDHRQRIARRGAEDLDGVDQRVLDDVSKVDVQVAIDHVHVVAEHPTDLVAQRGGKIEVVLDQIAFDEDVKDTLACTAGPTETVPHEQVDRVGPGRRCNEIPLHLWGAGCVPSLLSEELLRHVIRNRVGAGGRAASDVVRADAASIDRDIAHGLRTWPTDSDPIHLAIRIELRSRQGRDGVLLSVHTVKEGRVGNVDRDSGNIGQTCAIVDCVLEGRRSFETNRWCEGDEIVACVAGRPRVVQHGGAVCRVLDADHSQHVPHVRIRVVRQQIGNRDSNRFVNAGRGLVVDRGRRKLLDSRGDLEIHEVRLERRLVSGGCGQQRHDRRGGQLACALTDGLLAEHGGKDFALQGNRIANRLRLRENQATAWSQLVVVECLGRRRVGARQINLKIELQDRVAGGVGRRIVEVGVLRPGDRDVGHRRVVLLIEDLQARDIVADAGHNFEVIRLRAIAEGKTHGAEILIQPNAGKRVEDRHADRELAHISSRQEARLDGIVLGVHTLKGVTLGDLLDLDHAWRATANGVVQISQKIRSRVLDENVRIDLADTVDHPAVEPDVVLTVRAWVRAGRVEVPQQGLTTLQNGLSAVVGVELQRIVFVEDAVIIGV